VGYQVTKTGLIIPDERLRMLITLTIMNKFTLLVKQDLGYLCTEQLIN
jgi:hypothetical protein